MKLAASCLVAIPDAITAAVDPLDDPPVGNPLESDERIPAESDTPAHRVAQVGPQQFSIDMDDCIPGRGNGETSECGPEKWGGGHEAVDDGPTGHPQGVTDQHGSTSAQPAGEEEVEPGTVRRGDPRGTVAPDRHVLVDGFPSEDDVPVSWRKPASRNSRDGDRCACKGPEARGAAGTREDGERAGGEGAATPTYETIDHGPRTGARVPGSAAGVVTSDSSARRKSTGSAVGRLDRPIQTSVVRAVTRRSPVSCFRTS